MTDNLVYIANGGSGPDGITVAELDYANATLNIVQRVSEISECHYLNFHPNGRHLVATTMDDEAQVVSFAIDADGRLSLLSRQPAAGTSPAYVCVDASGRNVLMVNYVVGEARGNIRVYPIDEADGGLANPQNISSTRAVDRTPTGRKFPIRT